MQTFECIQIHARSLMLGELMIEYQEDISSSFKSDEFFILLIFFLFLQKQKFGSIR